MTYRHFGCMAMLLALMLVGCDGGADPHESVASAATSDSSDDTQTQEQAQPDPDAPLVVFLGDSLTAGYGLPEREAFPAVIERTLQEANVSVRVINAGISGDTTAGGLDRLSWLLKQKPKILVVGLGANDGLRGFNLKKSEENLRKILYRAGKAKVQVLLLGMQIPPNYGPDYAQRFAAMYPKLAEEKDVPLVPFLLEGVGGDPELNQSDGIHPTAEGQKILAQNVLPHLRAILAEVVKPEAEEDAQASDDVESDEVAAASEE